MMICVFSLRILVPSASQTDAALDFASIVALLAAELLRVQPSAARVLFCAPRVQAMVRVSTPAEEAERVKAEKARKANAASPWHTHSTDQLELFIFTGRPPSATRHRCESVTTVTGQLET